MVESLSERLKRLWQDPEMADRFRLGLEKTKWKRAPHTAPMTDEEYKLYRRLLGHKFTPAEALSIMKDGEKAPKPRKNPNSLIIKAS